MCTNSFFTFFEVDVPDKNLLVGISAAVIKKRTVVIHIYIYEVLSQLQGFNGFL